MPVEFLSDAEAASYGRFVGVPSRAELERFFFLDDADRALIAERRGTHNRLGFALQVTTARFRGRFLTDPLEVPDEVVVYLAEQLGIEDVSQVKRYAERRTTPFEHQEEIRKIYGLREFGAVEAEFTAWVDARAWSTGDGKKTIFHDGVVWLRERKVLLPGVTTLARLVARVRDDATDRLYDALYYVMTPRQRAVMELLLEVPGRPAGVGSGAVPAGPVGAVGQEHGEGPGPGGGDPVGRGGHADDSARSALPQVGGPGPVRDAGDRDAAAPPRPVPAARHPAGHRHLLGGQGGRRLPGPARRFDDHGADREGRDRHQQGTRPPAPQARQALGDARRRDRHPVGDLGVRRGPAPGPADGIDRRDRATPATARGGRRGARHGAAAGRRPRRRGPGAARGEDLDGVGVPQDPHHGHRVRRHRRGRTGAGGDEGAAAAAGRLQEEGAAGRRRRRLGDRVVAAAGVQDDAQWQHRRQERLRDVRAHPVPQAPAAPRHLFRDLNPLEGPARPAPGRPPVGGGQGAGAHRPVPARSPRPAPGRARPRPAPSAARCRLAARRRKRRGHGG
ncbi:DUF4158 domain-containing protein [Nonomuraea recticatena]|uniref:DUF4158 domain-containing protein n=1 Tax=Nonomuraea recticatena TaxID=46178 RepID=UPI0031FA1D9D